MDLALVFSGLLAAFVASALWATRPAAPARAHLGSPEERGSPRRA